MLRGILAIAAGFLLWSVLWIAGNAAASGLFPVDLENEVGPGNVAFLVLLLVVAMICSVASGWLTGGIARWRKRTFALALGILLLAVGIFVQSHYWTIMPLWYHLLFLALLVPATFFGGLLAVRPTVQVDATSAERRA